MQLHAYISEKVHYENLCSEMGRYEANADFQRDYYKQQKLAGRSPGNNDEVSIICFPYKLNIALEGW